MNASLRSSYRTDKVLFACHAGNHGQIRAGVLLSEHCLPLAFERDEETESTGFHKIWRRELDAFEFFCEAFGDAYPSLNGLWVYEVMWNLDDVVRGDTSHLHTGAFRRATAEELTSIARGECPWAEGVLL